jgi:hypothetical protein
MVEHGILRKWSSDTYKADVQISGSLTTYLNSINVSRDIASDQMVVGRHVIVVVPEDHPRDACVVAVFTM